MTIDISSSDISFCPVVGKLRIIIQKQTFEKNMTPIEMRILAIKFLQIAEEAESQIKFASRQ